jgi:GMP synthase (glutamine-hydrolysing)|tara:strand:+ start:1296 stop:1823 length:528 start_codon:yes stop_codon:yes gene_type:complete
MILIVSTCQEKLNELEFVTPIVELVGECEVKHYTEVTDVNDYEKIIICGTALQDNQLIEEIDKFSWLKKTEKPVLGICAGMQVIALTFGEKLINLQEIGMIEVNIKKENLLMKKNFSAYALHNYTVENLDEFEILAESKQTSQVIKHKNKPIYGTLFHPEVRNKEIINNFLEIKE